MKSRRSRLAAIALARDHTGATALTRAKREHITHNKDLDHDDWVAVRTLLRKYGAKE